MADASGGFAWAAPDEEVHDFVNDLERPIGTHLFLTPILVGGDTPALPGGVRLRLELLDERRFGNGVVHLHYRIRAT